MTSFIDVPALLLGFGIVTTTLGLGNSSCSLGAQTPDAEEEVIDRLIAVVKEGEASEVERAKACLALGRRGAKAKRAVPEITAFLKGAQQGVLRSESIALVAEGLGGIG